MGKTDKYLFPIYEKLFPTQQPIALLCFTKIPDFLNNKDVDLYDIQLNNFNLNDNWKLKRKYNSIICSRALFFCKDLKLFFKKCLHFLNAGGNIYVDFCFGWKPPKSKIYKVGWLKNGEHDYCYSKDNKVWSSIWDDSFLENEEVKKYQKKIVKFGYNTLNDFKLGVYNETPTLLELNELKKMFNHVKINLFTIWDDIPQLYLFINIVN